MAPRMIGPDGRDVLDVPASGVHAMRALGWTDLDTPAPTSAAEDTPDEHTDTPTPPKTPARKTGGRARRRVPKPGDSDD